MLIRDEVLGEAHWWRKLRSWREVMRWRSRGVEPVRWRLKV